MKIRPIILCGGEGTRLWKKSLNSEPKQFIDFGGWTLIEKTLNRIKNPIYDYPIISTNKKYLKKIRYFLKKKKFNKYKIILEPAKKKYRPRCFIFSFNKRYSKQTAFTFFTFGPSFRKKPSI